MRPQPLITDQMGISRARDRVVRAGAGRWCSLALAGLALALGSACQTVSASGPTRPFGAPPADDERAVRDAARAAALFEEGVRELERGDEADLRRATDAFRRASELQPELAIAHYNLGRVAEDQGDEAAAERSYRRALEVDPSLDLAADNLGRLWETRGRPEDAFALYQKTLEAFPAAVGPRLRIARRLRAQGEAQKAAALAREALQYDPTSLEAYRMLARLYAENQKGQLARLIAVRGQKLAPEDPELHYSLGLVAEQEGNLAEARGLWFGVVQREGGHLEARRALAELSLRIRDWHTAAAQLDALIGAGHRHPSLWVALGVARKGMGDFAGAREAYLRALEQDAGFGAALLNLAIIELRHLDQPADAQAHLERYLHSAEVMEPAAKLLDEAKVMLEAKRQEQAMMQRMAEEAARQGMSDPEGAASNTAAPDAAARDPAAQDAPVPAADAAAADTRSTKVPRAEDRASAGEAATSDGPSAPRRSAAPKRSSAKKSSPDPESIQTESKADAEDTLFD